MTVTAQFFVFSMMLMLSLNPEVDAMEEACEYNGCSVPFKLPFFYKRHFTPACNKHDICYRCGARFGWSKQQCDLAFKRDMDIICASPGISMKMTCFKFSLEYFSAVNVFGESSFQSVSPENAWCNNCPRVNGDPNDPLCHGD